ncbi:MAG: hypothetical protein ACE5OS_14565 [Anaerolineae bacterium]
MKRTTISIALLLTFSLACSLGGLPGGGGETVAPPTPTRQSEQRCGDGVCDGPENAQNCPQDCAPAQETPERAASPAPPTATPERAEGAYRLLYHVTENTVTSQDAGGTTCHTFNFLRFLNAGHVQPDGSGNVVLELKDNPTSKVTSKMQDRYFYISTPNDPLVESMGVQMFNWDVDGQTLWGADFAGGNPVAIAPSAGSKFPGDVSTAPGNRYLLYPLTDRAARGQSPTGVDLGRFDPFATDSSLVIVNLASGAETTVLAGRYNRELFTSLGDFSADGNAFYTLTREGDGFAFVKVSLDTGAVTDFRTLFPDFDWDALDWDAFFPRGGDFAYASFAISPDETRLIAYKDIFAVALDSPCVTLASHHLWVLDLERNTIEEYRDQRGSVIDAAWKADSSAFALALADHGGCYPGYIDASIERYDKDGRSPTVLVSEPESKITTIGWSPAGDVLAYDVYSTDYVGRLKLVDEATKSVREVINTQDLGYAVSQTNPVTLLFADWVAAER